VALITSYGIAGNAFITPVAYRWFASRLSADARHIAQHRDNFFTKTLHGLAAGGTIAASAAVLTKPRYRRTYHISKLKISGSSPSILRYNIVMRLSPSIALPSLCGHRSVYLTWLNTQNFSPFRHRLIASFWRDILINAGGGQRSRLRQTTTPSRWPGWVGRFSGAVTLTLALKRVAGRKMGGRARLAASRSARGTGGCAQATRGT